MGRRNSTKLIYVVLSVAVKITQNMNIQDKTHFYKSKIIEIENGPKCEKLSEKDTVPRF